MNAASLPEPSLTLSSTVTGKNQVTIPAEIARLLKIEPGVKLEWSAQADHQTIVVKRQLSRSELVDKLAGMGRDWKKPGAAPIAELIQERVQDDIDEGLW